MNEQEAKQQMIQAERFSISYRIGYCMGLLENCGEESRPYLTRMLEELERQRDQLNADISPIS